MAWIRYDQDQTGGLWTIKYSPHHATGPVQSTHILGQVADVALGEDGESSEDLGRGNDDLIVSRSPCSHRDH
jgi:hypothetical protein